MADSDGSVHAPPPQGGLTQEAKNSGDGRADASGGKAGDQSNPLNQGEAAQAERENGPDQKGPRHAKAKEKPSQFDRSLRLTDIFIAVFAGLSFLASAISASVAIWTAMQIKGTTEQTDRAIGKLAVLADQTKRHADAAVSQIDLVRQQVGEAKAQTKAISDQTVAIKSSAIAAVQGAQAEVAAAGAQAKSADSSKMAADLAAAANVPKFTLTAIDFTGLDSKPTAKNVIEFTIKPSFTNFGGGTAFPEMSLIKYFDGNSLPKTPDYKDGGVWGGNEIAISHDSVFFPNVPLKFSTTPDLAKAILDSKRAIAVFGYVNFVDGTGRQHHWCYVYGAFYRKDQPWTIFRIDVASTAAYHCEN